jgi:uncharacterized protein YdaT
MTWNMTDYPASLKNFDPLLRKKTIDIANALLENGYKDDRAIPIAISQAKEWMNNASEKEINEFKKADDPDKNDHHENDSGANDLLDNDVMVFYDDDRWAVKTKGAKQISETFDKKIRAVSRAKEIAANKESKLILYKKDGSKEK